MTMALLTTKLFVPPPRATLVPRPRLVARLNQGLAHPLTLISAPAGFGKTTLVCEWRASPAGRDYPLAWLSLDQDDNDPSRFLTYMTAALDTVLPDVAVSAPEMLPSPQAPPIQAYLTGLINDLAQFPRHFALVLDDYHLIDSGPVHETLAFLLDHLPPRMHLVILTRADPPLPLARLRARDQLVELSKDDLRFAKSETATFFEHVMGLELSADHVAALEQRTEGWIAGLQLAALAMQASPYMQGPEDVDRFIEAFTGSHHYVADYLAQEVLSRQPEAVRTFLLQTSILDRMTGELCDHLTGRSDSQAILRQLDQDNLFLIPLDEARRWYRYHHLFADLLRNRLQERAPDQIPTLHRRAADWHQRHGFVSQAITHSLAAGDQRQAARIIERNAMATLMRGDSVSVLNWISAVAPLLNERPLLGVYQSWALLIAGEIDPIETRLQAAEAWIEAHDSDAEAQEMRFHIAAIRALVAGRRGEAHQAIVLARQALDQLPENESAMRGIVTFTLGDMSWSIGDLSGAKRAFSEVIRTGMASGGSLPAILARSSIGVLLTEQGELHRAETNFQNVIQTATQSNGRIQPVAAVACLGLASLEYEWNHLSAAEGYAQQALELGARWGNPDTQANAHLMQARWHQARGDRAAALESLRQAEELARGPGVTPWSGLRIDAFRVRLWLEQGNIEAAQGWLRQHAIEPQAEITYAQQYGYLSLGRILLAQNRFDLALALLDRLLVQFEALELKGRSLELLILQALTLKAQGNTPRALAVLARALTQGEPEGYLRVFLDEGAPLADLLRYAGSRGIAPKYAARLLAAFNREVDTAPASQQPLIDPLTDRELQVLRLLAEGLSNQEIADRLVVALGTVKTHTASLYRKLGVSSRTQAVARAGELGLL